MQKIIDIYTRLMKIISRSKCVLGRGSVLYQESEIVNIYGDKNKISIGKNSHIRGQLMTFGHGGNIEIGDYCFVGKYTNIWSAKNIKIGNRVLIAHNVNIFDSDTHPIDSKERHENFKEIITRGYPKKIDLKEKSIIIHDDVWVGACSIILKGVTIGEGAVVGAGSVVTKDVEAYTLVVGNPAKFVKKIEHK
jgi:acetyltransferase-like isoleucine patch superfamily enzyme